MMIRWYLRFLVRIQVSDLLKNYFFISKELNSWDKGFPSPRKNKLISLKILSDQRSLNFEIEGDELKQKPNQIKTSNKQRNKYYINFILKKIIFIYTQKTKPASDLKYKIRKISDI